MKQRRGAVRCELEGGTATLIRLHAAISSPARRTIEIPGGIDSKGPSWTPSIRSTEGMEHRFLSVAGELVNHAVCIFAAAERPAVESAGMGDNTPCTLPVVSSAEGVKHLLR